MALSVAMQKDIGEYREKIFFGLTARSLLYIGVSCALAAVEALIAVGLLGIDVMDISLLLMCTVLVGFVAGYYRPLGMDMVDAAPLLWRQYFGASKLAYRTSLDIQMEKAKAAAAKELEAEADSQEKAASRREKSRYANERSQRGAASAEVLLPMIYAAANRDVAAVDVLEDNRE